MHPERLVDDGGIATFAEVGVGETVVMMESTKPSLIRRGASVARFAATTVGIKPDDIAGEYIVYCAGCSLALGDDVRAMVAATAKEVPAPFLMPFTFGEQGRLARGRLEHGNLLEPRAVEVVTPARSIDRCDKAGHRPTSSRHPPHDRSPAMGGPTISTGQAARQAQLQIERLARGGTSTSDERAIVDTLAALPVDVRRETLRLIDGGADRHTVDHLLSDDIDDDALRSRARALIGEARHAGPPPMPERLILSDIDDTVKPHHGDSPSRDVFPGARAFYAALDEGKHGTGTPGDVHFVTARDGVVMNGHRGAQATGIPHNSVSHGGLAFLRGHAGFADGKVKDLELLLQRNPGHPAVLIGDSTQADPVVFERMLAKHDDRVELALIHEIKGFPVPAHIAALDKVVVFSNYVDAATKLHARGLLSDAQLQAVVDEDKATRR